MAKLPSPLAMPPALRCSTRVSSSCSSSSATISCLSRGGQQLRRANFIHRPRRPYTFTQLVQLSDGSFYTQRTTSPQPLLRVTKDTRNTQLWQPSERSLRGIELDEAGKLAAFRERFGRAFDQQFADEDAGGADAKKADKADKGAANDAFADLISSYAVHDTSSMKEAPAPPAPAGKKKK
jgi:hypothetical protein